jgi:hypothetical protein
MSGEPVEADPATGEIIDGPVPIESEIVMPMATADQKTELVRLVTVSKITREDFNEIITEATGIIPDSPKANLIPKLNIKQAADVTDRINAVDWAAKYAPLEAE